MICGFTLDFSTFSAGFAKATFELYSHDNCSLYFFIEHNGKHLDNKVGISRL